MEFSWELLLAVIIALVGLGLFFHGFRRMHKWRMIKDTPRSMARSVAIGICEIHGKVRAKKLLKTPFSHSDAVYYQYVIKEYRRHVSRDSKGRTKTRYSWDTIASGSRALPFFGKDKTGEVLINPENAEFIVDCKKVFYQKAGLFGGIKTVISFLDSLTGDKDDLLDTTEMNLVPIANKKSFFSFGSRVGDRKYYEHFLEPDENLFVIGTATIDNDAPNKIVIQKGVDQPTFVISNKTEAAALKSIRNSMLLAFIFGALIFIGGLLFAAHLLGYI